MARPEEAIRILVARACDTGPGSSVDDSVSGQRLSTKLQRKVHASPAIASVFATTLPPGLVGWSGGRSATSLRGAVRVGRRNEGHILLAEGGGQRREANPVPLGPPTP